MTTPQEQHDIENMRAEVAFGLDVQQFMGTSMGRYLTARAQTEIDNAKDELIDADPDDPKAVRAIQNKAKVASMFLEWMGQAVTTGEIAQAEWRASAEGN